MFEKEKWNTVFLSEEMTAVKFNQTFLMNFEKQFPLQKIFLKLTTVLITRYF